LGKKLIKAQLEEIKSASQRVRQIPLVTREDLLSEISEHERRETQLESECTALKIDIGEKDGVIKSLKEGNVELKSMNKAQEDKLLWTMLQNARLIEAHKQAIKHLNRSSTETIKSYIWDRSTELHELQVRVAEEETKS